MADDGGRIALARNVDAHIVLLALTARGKGKRRHGQSRKLGASLFGRPGERKVSKAGKEVPTIEMKAWRGSRKREKVRMKGVMRG